jgi:hypothetical protein
MIEIYKFCEFVASIDKQISSDIDVKDPKNWWWRQLQESKTSFKACNDQIEFVIWCAHQ